MHTIVSHSFLEKKNYTRSKILFCKVHTCCVAKHEHLHFFICIGLARTERIFCSWIKTRIPDVNVGFYFACSKSIYLYTTWYFSIQNIFQVSEGVYRPEYYGHLRFSSLYPASCDTHTTDEHCRIYNTSGLKQNGT